MCEDMYWKATANSDYVAILQDIFPCYSPDCLEVIWNEES